jgi:hypothetical protein
MYDKSSSANHPMRTVLSPLARFGIDVLAGVGLALAVSGMIAALFTTTPAPTVPKASAAPIGQEAIVPVKYLKPNYEQWNVAQLRTEARKVLGPSYTLDGRRIAQAKKSDLVGALNFRAEW